MDPDFGYARLGRTLDSLRHAGAIILPSASSKAAYERRATTLLPKWIKLPSEKTESPPFAIEWDIRLAPMVRGSSTDKLEKLSRIDAYLKRTSGERPGKIPVNCRSLHIFGDEKTLLRLVRNRDTGEISPTLRLDDLHCYVPYESFLVHDACAGSASNDILVIENAQSYHIFKQRNEAERRYRAVVFGGGAAFKSSIPALEDLVRKLDAGKVLYFGDIDVPGFDIPVTAIQNASKRSSGFTIVPHLDLYRECLSVGSPQAATYEDRYDPNAAWDRAVSAFTRQWLGDEELYARIAEMIRSGNRIAQEWVC
ncbi:Wadjet anti-phage system protein JetD domain-containing protein [Microvirga sp. VF16]|uniref:Wadjet anti-phage system protein JetD domain-containing protein n=1 Tax=Microvirga sp. VF16 TaxID=2807101 RepID=UPI00193CF782|nr:Wadjet anti-phage system protein JetD domain-containing protein [Microvirga sp. VF16]QRM33467.1 hypothetical protein JO965_36090 [Microvirga sp. VF16]